MTADRLLLTTTNRYYTAVLTVGTKTGITSNDR